MGSTNNNTSSNREISSSSFDDNDLSPQEENDTENSVEGELLRLYETCVEISDDIASGRRKSVTRSTSTNKVQQLPVLSKHAYPCSETYSPIPKSPPGNWPQRPLLLRPSPGSGMRIIGIRHSSSKEYLPLPGTSYCLGCTLPINNGREEAGKCIVIDFESDLFVGSALLRIKNVADPFENPEKENGKFLPQSERSESDAADETSTSSLTSYYFHKRKRTFQALIHGRFKSPSIPMAECVTGQVFSRPAGKLPPRIIVKGAISVISHLAPQLQARLDGDCPRFLSPLVSTAQSVLKTKKTDSSIGANEEIEGGIHEPQPSDPSSLLQDLIHSAACSSIGSESLPADSPNIATRTKTRKKAFDKLFAHNLKNMKAPMEESMKGPTFDPNKEYTFEFFQHLISFEDFALDFVRPIGKQSLKGMLGGQPLKFMAGHQVRSGTGGGGGENIQWLWSFDLWHENLYQDAVDFENQQ